MDKGNLIERKNYQGHWFQNSYPETQYLNYVNDLGTGVRPRLPKKRGYPNMFLLDRRQRNLNLRGTTYARFHHGGGLEHQADKRDLYDMLNSLEKPHRGYLNLDVSSMTRGNGGNPVAGGE